MYDEFNRVTSETNADNETTSYTYDLQGNLTSITDAMSHITTFVYDDLGRLIETIDPIVETPTDKTVTYSYDEAGNRLTVTDRLGETSRTTFDAANRATLVEYLNDAASQSASYNQYGDNVAIASNDVTYSYSYNNRHLMTSKTDSRNNKSLNWAYDAAGNVTAKTDYQGSVTTFTYDDTNRLVAMANPAYLQASYQYDGAGRLLSRILSNGASTLYSYDRDGFLTKMTQRSADGSIIDERTYGHDDISNITSVVTAAETISYSYDPVYRLLSADSTINANDQSWTYDDVGNRLTMVYQANTLYYNYNNNGNRLDDIRIISAAGPILNSYDYDYNGSRIFKRDGGGAVIESYTYDQRRLISQLDTDNFVYDPNAYRIGKISAAGTNNYLLEGEHLEATYDENNQLKASYLRGVVIDEIINGFEKDANGKLINRSFHHDQVNSVLATTDHTGTATQITQYSPFGQSLSMSGADTNALKYTGRENDSNGLYYYRARYYDPFAGRFLSEDPLGFEAGVNFYVYVENNPLRFSDPRGLDTFKQNRQLGGAEPVEHVLSHTFTFTTSPDGSLQDTYSWGNTYTTSGIGNWHKNAPEDVQAATQALQQLQVYESASWWEKIFLPDNFGTKVGGPELDPFIEEAFQDRLNNPSHPSAHGWSLFCNCKHEANNLINDGQLLLQQNNSNNSTSLFNIFDPFSFGNANGGFVLYPNKLNMNSVQNVYSK